MRLECKKICKNFGSNRALIDVDLVVEGGEIRALLGGNGCGKSTLTKIIGGALNITSGTMEIDGKPYAPESPVAAKRSGVIFTSQELSLFDNLTVEANIALCNYSVNNLLKKEEKKTAEKVHELLDKYGLGYLAKKKIKDLAANEKYLVEFMKAIFQKAEILIIDEITSALYEGDVKIVRQIMHEYSAAGKIVLFISHRMPEIMDICDTVTVLRNGEVIDTHKVKEVTESQLLTEMTGVEVDATKRVAAAQDDESMHKTLMEVRDLSLEKFNTKIDLDLKEGEIVGIAGLQGQGQSDLVRKLFGLDAGEVKVGLEGKEISIRRPSDAINQGISFVSGDRTSEGVFPERSIDENLKLVSTLILKENIEADPVLKKFGVKYANKRDRIVSLSGGNQQKVVLGRWLNGNPLVVLMDDPTKGIDVQARRDVHQTLVRIAGTGSAVLMVSSDNDELVNITHMSPNSRVIVMYEGNIVKTLKGDEITVENIARASVNM